MIVGPVTLIGLFFIFFFIFNTFFGWRYGEKLFNSKICLCLVILFNMSMYILFYFYFYNLIYDYFKLRGTGNDGVIISVVTVLYNVVYLIFSSTLLKVLVNFSYHESIRFVSIPVVFGFIALFFYLIIL